MNVNGCLIDAPDADVERGLGRQTRGNMRKPIVIYLGLGLGILVLFTASGAGIYHLRPRDPTGLDESSTLTPFTQSTTEVAFPRGYITKSGKINVHKSSSEEDTSQRPAHKNNIANGPATTTAKILELYHAWTDAINAPTKTKTAQYFSQGVETRQPLPTETESKIPSQNHSVYFNHILTVKSHKNVFSKFSSLNFPIGLGQQR